MSGPASPLAVSAVQFFANDAAKNGLERFLAFLNEGPQSIVDLRLVIRAPSHVSLLSEPVEHVIVKANSDPSLAWRRRQNGAALGMGEVVILTHGHGSCSYCRVS